MEIEKEHLNFVIVGHVDHGKSTLIGRLLYDTNSIPQSIIEEVKSSAEDIGKGLEFAYLLDSLKEEREQNITIDTTQTFFHTGKRDYIIIDAPGHKEFLRNMITGASLASAAILMVDVGQGLEEQTRRHAFIVSLLGIKQVIVAVNKMDAVDYSQEEYEKTRDAATEFLKKIDLSPLHVIPVSALKGDNIANQSSAMPWYQGQILLEALDSLTAPESPQRKPLRMPIQDVYELEGKPVAVGRVESGTIKKGDKIALSPAGKEICVDSIEVWLQRRNKAKAGDSIGLRLSSLEGVERGVVLCSGDQAKVTNRIHTTLFWMDEKPLSTNEPLTIKCATQEVPCRVERVESRIDSSSLQVIGTDTDRIGEAEAGRVTISTDKPLVVEKFSAIEELGRFVCVRNEDIVAGGIITGWE